MVKNLQIKIKEYKRIEFKLETWTLDLYMLISSYSTVSSQNYFPIYSTEFVLNNKKV